MHVLVPSCLSIDLLQTSREPFDFPLHFFIIPLFAIQAPVFLTVDALFLAAPVPILDVTVHASDFYQALSTG